MKKAENSKKPESNESEQNIKKQESEQNINEQTWDTLDPKIIQKEDIDDNVTGNTGKHVSNE